MQFFLYLITRDDWIGLKDIIEGIYLALQIIPTLKLFHLTRCAGDYFDLPVYQNSSGKKKHPKEHT